jgi:DNA end-binding protein Ku
MPARSIWKGSISFGLVQIPVALYPAESPKELSFHLLDKETLSPIHFQRVSASTGEAVNYKDLVKGYKTKDGTYVVMTEQDFRRADVEATQTVDIVDFVDGGAIAPIYYDKPYFLAPVALRKGRATDSKAYSLLRETLKKTGKVGIAKVVIRTREHLAALIPVGNMLVLNLLRFAHELRDGSDIEAEGEAGNKAKVSPREMRMAEELVEEMTAAWDPRKYRDEYRDELLALIRKRVKSGKAHVIDESEVEAPEPAEEEPTDMLALLRKSLEKGGKGRRSSARVANRNASGGGKKAAAKKKTPASKKAGTTRRAA